MLFIDFKTIRSCLMDTRFSLWPMKLFSPESHIQIFLQTIENKNIEVIEYINEFFDNRILVIWFLFYKYLS